MSDRPVVIVSNRGPLTYRDEDGDLVARRGGGGLVSGLAPLMDEGRVTWISAALSDADRRAAAEGLPEATSQPVHLLDIDPDEFDRYYDVIANQTLWFVHHGLYDLTREPELDAEWHAAWDAYRSVNQRFAAAVIAHAPDGAAVLVQDYHLTLLAPTVRAARPDLSLVHFHHTPFAGPDGLRVLPPDQRREMLDALAAHHACGFHTPTWARNFLDVQHRWGSTTSPDRAHVFDATLNSDLDELRRTADSPACDTALAELDLIAGDRSLVVRVDRMELSKNIVRGFHAFDRLLERRVDWRGRVVFVACCYPSRPGVPAYARYRDEVLAAAGAVNRRWGDGTWTPVELFTDDDYPRSVAALRRYDVLLVNPVRDGLNLVAKEGPMLNERDGQLVLSTEAGAWSELLGGADGISPFDVEGTADALEAALDRDPDARAAQAGLLRRSALARTPGDWLADQLDSLRSSGRE
ncbi:MAG: trehalose-6-phosphate synthase [Actinobacteria bacterium]|nr:trehalose-6-phosphate synthase [Actinomycetota bacterium]